MYTRIVVAVDGSDLADKALRHALTLAKEFGAKLFVVHSTDPMVLAAPAAGLIAMDTGVILTEIEKANADMAKATLDEAKQVAQASGQVIETLHVPDSLPADAILSTASRQGADLIVMGSHGRRGLGRLLLGSQAAEVLAHSDIPVLVIK